MDQSKTEILDPTGLRKTSNVRLAPRPEDLKGLTVGLVDNGRWKTWGMVSQHYTSLLKERYGVGEVIYVNQEKNKLMYCAYECSPKIYSGELGMLSLAGDIGNWMADVDPNELNWLAKFISSITQTPAKPIDDRSSPRASGRG